MRMKRNYFRRRKGAFMRRERSSFINGGTCIKKKGHLLKRKGGTCENIKKIIPFLSRIIFFSSLFLIRGTLLLYIILTTLHIEFNYNYMHNQQTDIIK